MFVYSTLFLVTTLYAIALDRWKHRIEPDWTWLEVVIGVTVCLGAAAVAIRLDGGTPRWQDYERAVWLAFVVGGMPIILWRVWRMVTMRQEALTYAMQRGAYEYPATLAEKRGSSTPGDAGDCGGRAARLTRDARLEMKRNPLLAEVKLADVLTLLERIQRLMTEAKHGQE